MSYSPLEIPVLPETVRQLAGLLPLTALIEFIDLPSKLHGYELAGAIPLWNWPITPTGARLLLKTRDNDDACCLDRTDSSAVLHCIDGRYGAHYPSSAPTTTRLCVESAKKAVEIRNEHPNMVGPRMRRQKLEVILLQEDKTLVEPATKRSLLPCFNRGVLQRQRSSYQYRFMSGFGWLLWATGVGFSLAAALWVAAAYLILMPVSGLVVHLTHGGLPRIIRDDRPSSCTRVVIAADSLNGSDWMLFYGGNNTLNSLLNKSLTRTGRQPLPRFGGIILQTLIICQWLLAVASCALQDWNGIIITLWLAFCALASAHIYPAKSWIRDWLRLDCHMTVRKIKVEFGSRRAMLSAIAYLNPDMEPGSNGWINPILPPDENRTKWEEAIKRYVEHGPVEAKSPEREPYWYNLMEEGVAMGQSIHRVIHEDFKYRPPNSSS